MLNCLADGARYGYRHCTIGMLGVSLGNICLIIASALGLSLLLKQSPLAFTGLKYLGAAYLCYLGISMIRHGLKTGEDELQLEQSEVNKNKLFSKWFFIALSNPKGLIYFGALFPQFIRANEPAAIQFFVLAFVFLIIDFMWMSSYALGGKALLRILKSRKARQVFNSACGSALIAAAIALSLSSLN